MGIYERDQMKHLNSDIKALKLHEQKLTEAYKALNNEYDNIYSLNADLEKNLQEYLDSDLIVKQLISNIKRRMDYNKINLCQLYPIAWNKLYREEDKALLSA